MLPPAAVNPDAQLAAWYFDAGRAAERRSEPAVAAVCYEQAVAVSGTDGQAWHRLGVVRQLTGDNSRALAAYRRALELDPANVGAANNAGQILRQEGRLDEALDAFRRARVLRPKDATVTVNLATILLDLDQFSESSALLDEVLAADATHVEALATRGNLHLAQVRPADAEQDYARALARRPGSPELRYNLALVRLLQGNLAAGWADYEARLDQRGRDHRAFSRRPRWHHPAPLAGRTILVECEQGHGDTIQWLRYLPALAAQGANVVARVPDVLRPLLDLLPVRVDALGIGETAPAHDLHVPFGSLPFESATRLDSIPRPDGYLRHVAPHSRSWSGEIFRKPGWKIGLVWAGNPAHQFDRRRSIPLAMLARAFADVPAQFYALQKDWRAGDRKVATDWPGLVDLSPRLNDYGDTAAALAAMDLLITVDTSAAHLAGAMGRPAWVLLAAAPDWRWLLGRANSPWYSSLRLFRQEAAGNWESVLASVRAEMASLLADTRAGVSA